jgi:hypothetical protein
VTAAATLLRVEPDSPDLVAVAARAAEEYEVPENEVLVRLLLQLPCAADHRGFVERSVAARESQRLARDLSVTTAEYVSWRRPPAHGAPGLEDLLLRRIDEATARIVLERFHYLRSFRRGSDHFGGVYLDDGSERLAALLTVSPLDIHTMAEHLPSGVGPADVRVLARVFAFDWSPRNALSFLMSRLVNSLRQRPNPPRLLLTYVNPNVGFTGASYRAANWVIWGREHETRYAYLDGSYITDRELVARCGTSDPAQLVASVGNAVSFSRMPLRPLDIYAYPVDPGLRDELERREPLHLHRPAP